MALEQSIDWRAFRDFVTAHAVTPLVFDALKRARSSVPSQLFQDLQNDFLANVAHNLAFAAELLRLIAIFKSHGIQAVPFKGPMLAWLAYGDLSFRVFDDLDILVQRSDVTRAREILCRDGYRLASHYSGPQERLRSHWNDQITFARDGGFLQIDLHWNFAPRHSPFAIRTTVRTERVSMLGQRVQTMASEDLLIYLCAHGCKHLWQRLAWICDIAALARRRNLDWDAVIARAVGAERMLGLGLSLARDLLGLSLPANISALIARDKSLAKLTERSKVRLFQIPAAPPAAAREMLWMSLETRHSLISGLRYLCGLIMLPSEADWSIVRLPSALFFLYYPLRLMRLAWKHCGLALRASS